MQPQRIYNFSKILSVLGFLVLTNLENKMSAIKYHDFVLTY